MIRGLALREKRWSLMSLPSLLVNQISLLSANKALDLYMNCERACVELLPPKGVEIPDRRTFNCIGISVYNLSLNILFVTKQ